MFACIGERALAYSRGEVPFLFAKFNRVALKLGIAAHLREARVRGIVFVGGGLLGKPKRLLPLRDGGIGEFRRKAGECNRIAGIKCRLVLPEALHAGGDVIRGTAAEGFAHGLHGGPLTGGHQGSGGALDFRVGDGGAAVAGDAVGNGWVAHRIIISGC